MPNDMICTACGKAFSASSLDDQRTCADCRAASISERPLPSERLLATAIQSGMPKTNTAGGSSRELRGDVGIARRFRIREWIFGILLLVAVVAAAYIIIFLVCGWGALTEPQPETWFPHAG